MLWSQLAAPYGACGIVSIMMVCVFVQGRLNKTLRLSIYLFAFMSWVSTVGYGMFSLSDSSYAGTFQDIMHTYVVTVSVVLRSIISMILFMIGDSCDDRLVKCAVKWLHKCGCNVLCMSPDKKDYGHHNIPLECFGFAIDVLKGKGNQEIGVIGASTTGILAQNERRSKGHQKCGGFSQYV